MRFAKSQLVNVIHLRLIYSTAQWQLNTHMGAAGQKLFVKDYVHCVLAKCVNGASYVHTSIRQLSDM